MRGLNQNDWGLLRGFVSGTVTASLILAASVGISSEHWSGEQSRPGSSVARPVEATARPELNPLLEKHLKTIQGGAPMLPAQGVLVETEQGEQLMRHNVDHMLNPASVLKIATTVAALEKFGPDHRFRTVLTAAGTLEGQKLVGDLGIRSDGDPTFGKGSLDQVVDGLKQAGITGVDGDLVASGPISFHTTDEPDAAVRRLGEALESRGISISGSGRIAETVGGEELLAIESEPLIDIVARQNAHSINMVADNLGTAVGGPSGLRRYLVEQVGLEPASVYITHPSGLDDNGITVRGIMAVLRRLGEVCERYDIPIDRVMPLNGVDNSTMRDRVIDEGMKGSVLAKTGTQPSWHGGVTTLAGVANTERGIIYFVIFNSEGDVHTYRKWQDDLLEDTVAAVGGPRPLGRTENIVPEGKGDHRSHLLRPPALTLPSAKQEDPFDQKRGD